MTLISMITTITTIKNDRYHDHQIALPHLPQLLGGQPPLFHLFKHSFVPPLLFVNFTIAHLSRFVNVSRSIFQKIFKRFLTDTQFRTGVSFEKPSCLPRGPHGIMEKNRPIRSPAGERDGGAAFERRDDNAGKNLKTLAFTGHRKKEPVRLAYPGRDSGDRGAGGAAHLRRCGVADRLGRPGGAALAGPVSGCLRPDRLSGPEAGAALGPRRHRLFSGWRGTGFFAVDARSLVYYGRDILSHAAATMEVQQFLQKLAENPYLPAGADEIRRVERIREHRSHYALVCQVRHPNRRTVRRTYFLVKGLEDQELLLHQLERRSRLGKTTWMPQKTGSPFSFCSAPWPAAVLSSCAC